MAGTLDETLDQPGLAHQSLIQAQEAFLTGMHVAIGTGGLLTLAVGMVAWLWLPSKLPE
nr:hypothetical protein [Sinorhizobium meliloti]